MSTKAFGQIEDEQLLTELLSYCDFCSAVAAGQTCSRLKRCSDAALGKWADVAASRVDGDQYPRFIHGSSDTDEQIIADAHYQDEYIYKLGEMRRGWTEDMFSSRASLIDEALTQVYVRQRYADMVEYDEDRARFLLRSRGTVDIIDFAIVGEEDDDELKEYGWKLKIRHDNITISDAKEKILSAILQIKSEEEVVENTEQELK